MTTLNLPQSQSLVLDLVSTCRDVSASRLSRLDDEDWRQVLALVRRHRLGPLLHRRVTAERSGLPLPGAVRRALAGSYRASAFRALELQRELALVTNVLAGAGIDAIALKGAYLAFFAYPDPALRPLRDLDLLVREGEALRAHQVLLAAGYAPDVRSAAHVETVAAVAKHLPPLVSAAGSVPLELHTRLDDRGPAGQASPLLAGLWERAASRAPAGRPVLYPSPTDLLLHLVVHALYVHRFTNGPLVLADISFLIAESRIDWPRFWRLAHAGGWTRGCELLLAMAQHWFGPLEVAVGPRAGDRLAAAERFVPACTQLLLRDPDIKFDIKVARALEGRGPRAHAGYALRRMFPPRRDLAALYPVSPGSPTLPIWYAANVTRVLTRRVPAYLRNHRSAAVAAELRGLAELDHWLEAG